MRRLHLRWRRGAVLSTGLWLVLGVACHASNPTAAPLGDISHAASGQERVDLIAQRCARIASCAHRHDAPTFRDPAACVDYWLEHLGDKQEPVSPCLSMAASCSDVETCLHGKGDDRAKAFCAAHPDVATGCDGDALVTCSKDDPEESSSTPCTPMGAVCGETRSAGGLVAHGCLSPGVCAPDVGGTRCDGPGAIVTCHDQVLERTECKTGTTCRVHADEDGERLATCEGPAEVACDVIGARACRGSTLVRCEAHGHHGREAEVDCAAIGLQCGQSGGRAACTLRESACTTGAPRCSAGDLVFCAAGRVERANCKELGLGPCEAEGKGPIALCAVGPARSRR